MSALVLVITAADKIPDDNDVVAGWGAFGVFLLLILAVAFLGWSLSRQFKKVRAAREAGVYDDEPTPKAAAPAPQARDTSREQHPTD
ncbi:MAG: hypothetical protein QM638_11735 [Nocardioides sp.]|uniref:hypothetical protein n=1 Tax=Nocardioides sp. TaxID=35761 RepID=UPI0039E60DDB